MKFLKAILPIVLLAAAALPSQAQFRYGVKVGMDVNALHFNSSVMDSNNRAGFTGGVMCEFTVPVIGVGFDLSAMYVRRNTRWMEDNNVATNNRDYIEIPLNLKYRFSLPVINNLVCPFIVTGPSVAFLTSRRITDVGLRNKSCDFAWNFGLGLQIVNHLQIAASYGLGITKAVEAVGLGQGAAIDGKNRYWTVTAAYLF